MKQESIISLQQKKKFQHKKWISSTFVVPSFFEIQDFIWFVDLGKCLLWVVRLETSLLKLVYSSYESKLLPILSKVTIDMVNCNFELTLSNILIACLTGSLALIRLYLKLLEILIVDIDPHDAIKSPIKTGTH